MDNTYEVTIQATIFVTVKAAYSAEAKNKAYTLLSRIVHDSNISGKCMIDAHEDDVRMLTPGAHPKAGAPVPDSRLSWDTTSVSST